MNATQLNALSRKTLFSGKASQKAAPCALASVCVMIGPMNVTIQTPGFMRSR